MADPLSDSEQDRVDAAHIAAHIVAIHNAWNAHVSNPEMSDAARTVSRWMERALAAEARVTDLETDMAHGICLGCAENMGRLAGENEGLRAIVAEFAEQHGRFHPDFWAHDGLGGPGKRCDACTLCFAAAALAPVSEDRKEPK